MNLSAGQEANVHRTFRDISQEDMSDIYLPSMLSRKNGLSGFGWDTVLKSKRVLIISEAGAGKTYECRSQQQALWQLGVPAFYIELAQLATDNLREILSTPEEDRLDAWLASQSDVAVFFLDSIDELKLTLGSFETALKRLSKTISGQLGRVKIVITTRPISIEQELIQKHLPVPELIELSYDADEFAKIASGQTRPKANREILEPVPAWRNVALMALTDDQIKEMAVSLGIKDADVLLADINLRHAQEFAGRPQDLLELCSDWRAHHRIRTHREQVINNIKVKLKPRHNGPEPAQLSPEKSFEGASRLALAAVLTRKLTIRLSVNADNCNPPGTALDSADILSDWTPEERTTLLQRPLFGFASYGRVRFHHRSVFEFLAAERLNDRLNFGMPIKAVKRILFVETPDGTRVVRPIMRPIAAWLAASQSSIFFEVRDCEPEILLDHADPESLSRPQCIDALKSYVHHYGKGGYRGMRVPEVQVHRFARHDLAYCVSELWQVGIENQEVRELFLALIGTAPMPTCADIAHKVVFDSNAESDERFQAVAAMVGLNDDRIDVLTQSIVDTPTLWPDRLIRGIVLQLFPHHISPERFCEIMGQIQDTKSINGDLSWMLPLTVEKFNFSSGYLEKLRIGITDLITDGLRWEKEWPHFSSKRPHLLSALAAICLRQMESSGMNAELLRSSVVVLRLQSDDRFSNEAIKKLRLALAELPSAIREDIFWIDDAFTESLHPEWDMARSIVETVFYGVLELNYSQDGSWVRRILVDPLRPLRERRIMVELSMRRVLDLNGDAETYIESLKHDVADRPELVELIDLFLERPQVDAENLKVEARLKRRREIGSLRAERNHADWVAFWREVAEHPEIAFSLDRKGSTAWNLWQAMQQSGEESRSSGWNRRFIEQYFDKEVADRLRKSMLTIWRNDRPTLRIEQAIEERGTILIRWQLGLAAIAAEAEEPLWASKLSTAEAKLAARYVPLESSGFPAWLEALVNEHPDAVEETLGPLLTAELDEVIAKDSYGRVLENISYSPPTVIRLFIPRLRAWFERWRGGDCFAESPLAAAEQLRRVLEILIEHDNQYTKEKIRILAEGEVANGNNGPFTQVWLTTLMKVAPAVGVGVLERLLMEIEPSINGPAVKYFGSMFGNRSGYLLVDLRNTGFTPTLLLSLVRLAYQHVRPSDDVSHEGTYSVDIRDEAESGRNALLTAIIDAKGTEAWAVKLRMLEDPLFAHFRDRLALLAREKAAEEADCIAYTESVVVTLDRYGEAPPMTRDDMFSLLVDRLDDLDDLLLQDVSPRAGWAVLDSERVMRQMLALQLRNASNQIYSVDQEAVTADEKETDIRLRVALSGQQGTIELKLGERWTGRQLRDTIKNQLVTKYMSAESCRAGCLLVTVAKKHSWKHPETRENLDIDGLRIMLNVEAVRLVSEMGGSIRVAIKVLDLRPRLSSEVNSKFKS